jgi:hypothetical protein
MNAFRRPAGLNGAPGGLGTCVPLDPVDQACFLNSSTSTRVFSL